MSRHPNLARFVALCGPRPARALARMVLRSQPDPDAVVRLAVEHAIPVCSECSVDFPGDLDDALAYWRRGNRREALVYLERALPDFAGLADLLDRP